MPFFADQSRDQLRQVYLGAWRKFKAGAPLEPLETELVTVISEHPEYIPLMESEAALGAEFSPESGRMNPFLHLGLHLAVREQISTDRPAGIAEVHRDLSARLGGAHAAEHLMLEQLGEIIWEAQRSGRAPSEWDYLERLRKL